MLFRRKIVVSASDVGKAAFCPHALSLGKGATSEPGESRTQRGTRAHNELNQRLSEPEDKRCFVASYALGQEHPGTQALRAWRDRVLRPTLAGRVLISTYYVISPRLIDWFGHSVMFRQLSTILVLWLAANLGNQADTSIDRRQPWKR